MPSLLNGHPVLFAIHMQKYCKLYIWTPCFLKNKKFGRQISNSWLILWAHVCMYFLDWVEMTYQPACVIIRSWLTPWQTELAMTISHSADCNPSYLEVCVYFLDRVEMTCQPACVNHEVLLCNLVVGWYLAHQVGLVGYGEAPGPGYCIWILCHYLSKVTNGLGWDDFPW